MIGKLASRTSHAGDAAPQHRMGRASWVLPLAAALLAGCAAVAPKSPENAVAERAQQRWDALLADEVEAAYALYSPGYRSTVSRKAFARRLAVQRVRWTAAKLKDVSCEPEICKARFDVTYKYNMPVQGVGTVESSRVITEDWILADEAWFYVPPDRSGKGLR